MKGIDDMWSFSLLILKKKIKGSRNNFITMIKKNGSFGNYVCLKINTLRNFGYRPKKEKEIQREMVYIYIYIYAINSGRRP
jgi:hypothetical protein